MLFRSEIETDLGIWKVYETPGHAPSHVCLFQPERRLLISGDHLLGRVSLYYDYGYTPDPVAEFVSSLSVVELLGDGIRVEEAASRAGTIGYEILTRIGARVAGVTVESWVTGWPGPAALFTEGAAPPMRPFIWNASGPKPRTMKFPLPYAAQ